MLCRSGRRAKRVRELTVKWAENTIQLGESFGGSGDPTGKSGSKSVEVSPSHADKLIRIAEVFGDHNTGGIVAGSFKVLDYLRRASERG
jgi:hypothetical protein